MRLAVISNRDKNTGKFTLPKDGWFQIAPLGEFSHPTGIIQVIDREAIDAMVNRFETEAKEPNFPGLLLDFDHFSNDSKAPSEAAGWIEALANRFDEKNPTAASNGLWAKIRFSDVGESAVVNGRYRLTSPVWNRKECEDLGNKKFRPQRLDRCALTNDPVLKGMVPLSNRMLPEVDTDTAATLEDLQNRLQVAEEKLENAGNAAGAHKGWETRRGALSAHHTASAKMHRDMAGRTKDEANKASHLKMAADHEKLAAGYSGKAKVSGAKANINAQLDKLRKGKAAKTSAPAKGARKIVPATTTK